MNKFPRWLPWSLIAVAFAAAWLYSETEIQGVQQATVGTFSFALAGALVIWGIEEMVDGKIHVRTIRVNRVDSPKTFFAMVLISRFVPGAVMLCGVLWYVFAEH